MLRPYIQEFEVDKIPGIKYVRDKFNAVLPNHIYYDQDPDVDMGTKLTKSFLTINKLLSSGFSFFSSGFSFFSSESSFLEESNNYYINQNITKNN